MGLRRQGGSSDPDAAIRDGTQVLRRAGCRARRQQVGYIDNSGTFVVTAQFAGAASFEGGLARVNFGKFRWGFIDKTGKTIWKPPSE